MATNTLKANIVNLVSGIGDFYTNIANKLSDINSDQDVSPELKNESQEILRKAYELNNAAKSFNDKASSDINSITRADIDNMWDHYMSVLNEYSNLANETGREVLPHESRNVLPAARGKLLDEFESIASENSQSMGPHLSEVNKPQAIAFSPANSNAQVQQDILMNSEASRQAASYAGRARAEYVSGKTPGERAFDQAKAEATAEFSQSPTPRNLGGEDRAAIQSYQKDTANAYAEHVKDVVDGGGTVAQAKEQVDKVAEIYASGDQKKIQDWENFVKNHQQAVVDTQTNAQGIAAMAAPMVTDPLAAALSGQSAFVQQKVREAIANGNQSSPHDLAAWFRQEEANAIAANANAIAAAAAPPPPDPFAALAGESGFVQQKVREAKANGNQSSVGDLITWFRQEEANAIAANAQAIAAMAAPQVDPLAGVSSYVRNKVIEAQNNGNTSSVNDLISWFKAEEANAAANAATLSSVAGIRHSQTPPPPFNPPSRGGGGGGLKYM